MVYKRKSFKKTIITFGLWVIALLHVYPLILILISSLKSKAELAINPIGLPKNIFFENFSRAFSIMNYTRSIFNTGFIVVCTLFILILISSMAAYAIVRRKSKFYNGMYLFFLLGLFVPFQMTMIPLYKIMLSLQLINSYRGVIFVYLALLSPFSIFLFSGFIKTVPIELEEAAKIDGCKLYSIFFRIVIPILKPAVATIVVLDAFSIWNDFLMPTLFLQIKEKKTIIVQLYSFVGQYFNDWSLILAAIFMIIYPILILYLFAQKYIISGITAGAIKG